MRASAVHALFGAGEMTADVETLRKRIRKRIAELEEDIAELEEYHSSLSPAILLPSEILSNIFAMHRKGLQEKACRWWNPAPVETLSWIGITHVCRRWRDIAIGCPSLWSELSFYHPAFTDIMLQRSRDALLCVRHYYKEGASQESQTVIHKALSQTRRLRIVAIYTAKQAPVDFSSVLSHFGSRTCNLERLSLTDYGDGKQNYPEEFLGGYAPVLKELALTQWQCPANIWKSLPFGSIYLTALSLHSPDNCGRPAIQDFVNAVQRMPSLRTMELGNNLPLAFPEYPSSHHQACFSLPALETLQLSDDIHSLRNFFTFVKLPTIASINASFTDERLDSQSLSRFLGALKASCVLARWEVTGFQICEFCADGPLFVFSYGDTLAITLAFDAIPVVSLQELVATYQAQFDLSTLTELHIRDTTSRSTDRAFWNATLSRLPKLERLYFFMCSIDEFVDALKVRPTGQESFHHFPALSSISLRRVDFNLGLSEDPEESTAQAIIDGLIEALRWREGLCPVRVLEFDLCLGFAEEDLLRIKAAVPSLTIVCGRFTNAKSWQELYAQG